MSENPQDPSWERPDVPTSPPAGGLQDDARVDAPTAGTLYARIGGRERLMLLLRRFYADVRQQGLIGPIFNETIHDWPAHLEKIGDFWSNVTGGPIRYSGPMPFKHVPLGLAPEHFDAWLDLWRRHCRAHIGGAEGEELIAAAESIGERIRWVIARFGSDTAD